MSGAVVLAELGHERIIKFSSIVSVYFLRESKLPAKLRQAFQYISNLLNFSMDRAMNILFNDQSCGESNCVCDNMNMYMVSF